LCDSIIGHGRRCKQAHDESHDCIKYRRGLCKLCKLTFTFLPAFSLPYTLIRATGIRVGECIDLSLDCLRQVNGKRWALHVPLGKLHSERWVPVDEETRRIVARILELRAFAPASCLAKSHSFLLPRRGARNTLYRILHRTLADAAQRAACTTRVNPDRLRHSYATSMLRLGISLPALMQILGHKDIRMTLRYVQITQQDLQQAFQRAHQNTAQLHPIPQLPVPPTETTMLRADLSNIRNAISATRHLLRMLQLQLQDATASRRLRRLTQRLLNISHELDHLPQKMSAHWPVNSLYHARSGSDNLTASAAPLLNQSRHSHRGLWLCSVQFS
jgi:hypothetical protein